MNDTDLRKALYDLGDVPPPPDLAGAALARARRDRRRTLTGLIAGVAVLAAAAVTVPAVVLGHRDAAPVAARTGVAVSGFLSFNPQLPGDRGEKRVYDPSSGQYVTPEWSAAVPSPDGRQVAVTSYSDVSRGTSRIGVVAADRVLDPAAVRWVTASGRDRTSPALDLSGVWSPDGSRVIFSAGTSVESDPTGARYDWRIIVVDAGTLASHEVTMTYTGPAETDTEGFDPVVFGPGGRGFAVVPTGGPLLLFDERGKPAGTVRTGPATLPNQPFSPDGRLVAVRVGGSTGHVGGSTRVLDTATGAEVGRVEGTVIGWLDNGRYAVWAGRSVRVVELGSGRVVAEREAPIAAPRVIFAAWLAPVTGAAPAGGIVL